MKPTKLTPVTMQWVPCPKSPSTSTGKTSSHSTLIHTRTTCWRMTEMYGLSPSSPQDVAAATNSPPSGKVSNRPAPQVTTSSLATWTRAPQMARRSCATTQVMSTSSILQQFWRTVLTRASLQITRVPMTTLAVLTLTLATTVTTMVSVRLILISSKVMEHLPSQLTKFRLLLRST